MVNKVAGEKTGQRKNLSLVTPLVTPRVNIHRGGCLQEQRAFKCFTCETFVVLTMWVQYLPGQLRQRLPKSCCASDYVASLRRKRGHCGRVSRRVVNQRPLCRLIFYRHLPEQLLPRWQKFCCAANSGHTLDVVLGGDDRRGGRHPCSKLHDMPEHATNQAADMPGSVRVSVEAAARRLGLSENAIRKRIERGTLKSEKIDGVRYVVLDTDMSEHAADMSTDTNLIVTRLESEVEWLRREVERKDTIIMSLSKVSPP